MKVYWMRFSFYASPTLPCWRTVRSSPKRDLDISLQQRIPQPDGVWCGITSAFHNSVVPADSSSTNARIKMEYDIRVEGTRRSWRQRVPQCLLICDTQTLASRQNDSFLKLIYLLLAGLIGSLLSCTQQVKQFSLSRSREIPMCVD